MDIVDIVLPFFRSHWDVAALVLVFWQAGFLSVFQVRFVVPVAKGKKLVFALFLVSK